jgi:CubicO group peptidase (beta-lactamase class C family)
MRKLLYESGRLAGRFLLPLGCSVLLAVCFAQFASGRYGTVGDPSSPGAPADPKVVEAFLDQFFKTKMEEFHCPGATVVVVKDGRILLAKGYGYGDVSTRTPVDPEKTRFYVASVSKLFTATAVVQLYDRGMLRLNEDVNRYLKHTRLDNNYPQPVTPFNLLTHTAGLEDLSFLMGGTPHRVFPAGAVISYTNYGFELAGDIVADVSGTPFAEYVEKNILQPLEMTHSSFVPPPDGAPDVARGYTFEGGRFIPVGRPMAEVTPAGSLTSTATDMAHFMIVHLQDGRYDATRILSENAARLMHERQISNHPKLPGMGLGFWEEFKNGQRALQHGGDLLGFQSRLYILPDKNVGLFVGINTSSRELPLDLTNQFMDRFYPAPESPMTSAPTPKESLVRYAGHYLWTRCPRSTIGKVAASSFEIKVMPEENGTLTLTFPFVFPWGKIHYTEVEPLLFRPFPGSMNTDEIGFREDSRGRITFLFQGPLAFAKLRWWQTTPVQLGLGATLLGVFLLACLGLAAHHLFRRLRKVPSTSTSPLARAAKNLVWVVGLLSLGFVAGTALTFAVVGPYGLGGGVPRPIRWLLVIPLVTAVLAAALFVLDVLAWKNAWWSLPARLLHSVYALSTLGFVAYLNYWNLLGFHY